MLLERIASGMSAPDPKFEQLLSSYLDGAVTDEERAIVEERLATDPDAARELSELRALSESIAAADVFGQVQLPRAFADQVVEAAIERARLEGHPEDHPLLRSAAQPLGPATPDATLANARRWWAASGVGLAVAASLLVAVTMLQPGTSPDAGKNGLALVGQPSQIDEAVPTKVIDEIATSPTLNDLADGTDSPKPSALPAEAVVPSIEVPKPSVESVAISTTDAMVDSSSTPVPAVTKRSPANVDRPNLKLAMVLNVQLNESAVGMAVIRDAMRKARVDSRTQQTVTDEIVASVSKAAGNSEASGALIYLRAPAKQMDRFVAVLHNDRDRVAGVRLGLTDEPVVLDAVNDFVQVDPTKVQHEFTGVLSADQASMLRDRVDDVVFIPADAMGTSMVGVAAEDSGPDVISHVLVLVGR